MVQRIEFELPVDTSHFTALQLQQRAVFSLAWNGYACWLKEYVVSLPKLIQEHHLGTVIIGAHIDYLEPFTFFEADTLQVRVEVQPWAGQILELKAFFYGDDRNVVKVTILLYPVAIQETTTLAAVPSRIPGYLLPKFQPDEDDLSRPIPDIEVQAWVQRIEQGGRLLATSRGEFMIHNHLIEVAEQWAFIETPTIVQSVRERLALNQHEKIPELRRSLSHPLQDFRVELHRPYYIYEMGWVETRAYQWQDELAFIHRLYSEHYRDEVHGTVVEQF